MSTGCQKDRQTGQQNEPTDRQKDFPAQLSKQKLFRMSTGCQNYRQTGRAPGRQTE